jgi:hypothetical protein
MHKANNRLLMNPTHAAAAAAAETPCSYTLQMCHSCCSAAFEQWRSTN